MTCLGRQAATVSLALVMSGAWIGWASRVRADGPETSCAPEVASTVDRMATRIAAQVRAAVAPHAGRGSDVALVTQSVFPAGTPRGEALVSALTGPTLAMLPSVPGVASVTVVREGAVASEDTPAAVAAAAREGFELLVRLRFVVEGNYLLVNGRVTTSARRWWRRSIAQPGTQLGAPWVRERLDVELRGYVGMLPAVEGPAVSAHATRLPSTGYVAALVAQLDDDEAGEIVLLRADAVEVLDPQAVTTEGPALTILQESLESIPRAPSPRRRAIGTIAVERGAEGARIVGRSSDRASAFVLEGATRQVVSLETPDYPLDRCAAARAAPGRDVFEAALVSRCAEESAGPAVAAFYARATTVLRTTSGERVSIEAVTTPDGEARLRVGSAAVQVIPDAGAAIAMADVNDDGDLELLTSSASAIGEHDRLTLRIVRPDGTQRVGWTGPDLPGSVMVATQGDVDGDGLTELLAIEEPPPGSGRPSRLWIVR